MFFILFLAFIIIQRLAELVIANRNEKWMKTQGAIEHGQEHYPVMVAMHITFFIAFIVEVLVWEKQLSPIWPILLSLFILAQFVRIWVLSTLGRYWNTKIIVLPNTTIVKRGPFKYLRHPNYSIVALEILLIPILFQAYWTALVFSILNLWMLSVRIPIEEKALISETDYLEQFKKVSRFPVPFKTRERLE